MIDYWCVSDNNMCNREYMCKNICVTEIILDKYVWDNMCEIIDNR